jgi:hypothetical protein
MSSVGLTLSLVAVGVGVVPGAVVQASAAPRQVKLATEQVEAELQVRPRVLDYTGDGTAYLAGRASSPGHLDRGGLNWISWKRRRAFARGVDWIDDCRPDCARGNFHPHRATLRADRPRRGLFTRITVAFDFYGRRLHERRVLRHFPPFEGAPGYFMWG